MTIDELRYLSTEHYDAIVEAYAIQPTTREVLLLSLIGEPDAIKALRASLSLGLPFTITGVTRCIWPQESAQTLTLQQRRLPAGPHAALWLPQRGTSMGIQHDTHAYLISRTPDDKHCPPSFFSILDRVFACPIREDWAGALWEEARQQGWLKMMDCYNCTVWELEPQPDAVIRWIQQQLRRRRLPVDTTQAVTA